MTAGRHQYGTLGWFEHQYDTAAEDPWGLTWRPSQRLRYQRVLATLQTIEEPLLRVMDVGCATGEFTHLMAKSVGPDGRVLGVDFTPAAIERARRRFPDVTFVTESIFSLGARYHGQFDLAVCLEVLYYIDTDKRAAAIRSLRESLREDGYVALSSFIGPPPHFAPDELLGLIATEFEVVRSELLYLRGVSLIEKLGRRLDAGRVGRRGVNGLGRRIGSLPSPAVAAIEKWSRLLGALAASHVLVLARAKKAESLT